MYENIAEFDLTADRRVLNAFHFPNSLARTQAWNGNRQGRRAELKQQILTSVRGTRLTANAPRAGDVWTLPAEPHRRNKLPLGNG